jgi:hypothetical protein
MNSKFVGLAARAKGNFSLCIRSYLPEDPIPRRKMDTACRGQGQMTDENEQKYQKSC